MSEEGGKIEGQNGNGIGRDGVCSFGGLMLTVVMSTDIMLERNYTKTPRKVRVFRYRKRT